MKTHCLENKRIVFFFCFVVLLAFLLVGAKPPTLLAASAPSAEHAEALNLLNLDRAKEGLPPLVYNTRLARLAQSYAEDMIERRFFSHDNPEGLTPFDRMNRAGISYRHAGENLAVNDSVAAAETAFMNSPSHRDNILSPKFTEVGIGVKYAPNGKVYVVQEFIGQ